ncbi:MAG TPA: hypothetical protein VIQ48_14590 [Rhodanobacter sp.]
MSGIASWSAPWVLPARCGGGVETTTGFPFFSGVGVGFPALDAAAGSATPDTPV